MLLRFGLVSLLSLMFVAVGCSKEEATDTADAGEKSEATSSSDDPATRAKEPDFITVQHILVGFEGSVPGKSITRSQAEAGELAAELLERAQKGEDFDGLVKEYTDDSHPGIYKMANFGQTADMQKVFARERMVRAFGDVGFPLEVGEVGLAEYDPETSQYGWHLIKRVE